MCVWVSEWERETRERNKRERRERHYGMSYIIFCIHRSYTFTISHTLYYLLLTNGNCGNFFPFISQGTSVLSPGLHIGLIIILAIMIYKKSATNMFEKHPCLYTLMFGCVFAKVAQKLVVRNSFIKDSWYINIIVFQPQIWEQFLIKCWFSIMVSAA